MSTKKYKTNINGLKGKNRKQYNNSRYCNIQLTTMDRSSRQKVNKKTLDLNTTLEQMNL